MLNGVFRCALIILKLLKWRPFIKNDRENISNYRPISILCNISKNFENLIFSRLQYFFQTSSSLSTNQYGFWKNSNTELATLQLLNKVLPTMEEKLYSICVFLYYKACFDTLSRPILFRKLERYGIRSSP